HWSMLLSLSNSAAAPWPSTLSLHDALPICLLFGAYPGIGVKAAGTLAQQRRGIGHAAHDGARLRAEPVLQAVATDAGCETISGRSEEHTSELQSRENLVCRLLLEKKRSGKQ